MKVILTTLLVLIIAWRPQKGDTITTERRTEKTNLGGANDQSNEDLDAVVPSMPIYPWLCDQPITYKLTMDRLTPPRQEPDSADRVDWSISPTRQPPRFFRQASTFSSSTPCPHDAAATPSACSSDCPYLIDFCFSRRQDIRKREWGGTGCLTCHERSGCHTGPPETPQGAARSASPAVDMCKARPLEATITLKRLAPLDTGPPRNTYSTKPARKPLRWINPTVFSPL